MKKIVFITALLIISSCSVSKNNPTENVTMNEKKVNTRNLVAILGETKIQSKEFTVNNAVVNGNILEIEVSYYGSCQAHDFICTGSTMISKSFPPIRSIQLVHYGKEDSCKELVTEVLKIDITAFAYKKEDGSQIKLNLSGWQEQLTYTYSAKNAPKKVQQHLDSKGLQVEKKK
jgi:uncharacterized lipoprotein YehR (DUF1307 family)